MQSFTLVSTQRECLLREIAIRINQSVDVQTILETAVLEARQLLQADRVFVFQFSPEMSGQVVAESVAAGLPVLLNRQFHDTCFWQGGRQYRQGDQWAVSNVHQANLAEWHLQLLETLQTQANLAVPILMLDRLWGLLVVHQCMNVRQWQADELELMDQLAVYLAIALQQATMHQQLQEELNTRRQVEARLRASEQRYATLLASAPVGIFYTDAAGNCTYVNDRWCQITGLSPEAALGTGWQQGLHPGDRDRIAIEWYRSAQENRPFWLEYRFQRSDGTVTYVYGQSIAEQDAEGQVVGYVGTITDINERKRSEEALQKSEAHQKALIQAIPDLIMRVSRSGVNLEFLATPNFPIVGDLSTMVGMHITDTLPSELAQKRLSAIERALQTNAIQIHEQQLVIDGKTQIEEVRVVPYSSEEVLVLVRDITARKQAEIALQCLMESTASVTGKNFFSTLAQQLMLALKVQYVIVAKLTGDHLQTLAYWKDGQPQPNLIYSLADAPCCALAIADGQFYCPHGLRQRFSGYPFIQVLQAESYLGIPLTSSNGDRIGNLCILDNQPMEDVQWAEAFLRIFAMRAAAELERQQATESLEQLNRELEVRVEQRTAALRGNEAKLSAIFNQAAVGMNLAALDGQYFKINQKLCDILGYTQAELLTKKFQELSYLEDASKGEAERQLLYAGRIDSFSIEKRYLRKNGSVVWANLTVSLVRKPSGEPDYTIGIIEDVSRRKQAEFQLQKAHDHLLVVNAELARATQLKNEFLANMSHELRTPLNAVLGLSEVLLEGIYGSLSDRQQKAITTIEQSGSHLLELINDVLDLAKIEAGKLKLELSTVSTQKLCAASVVFVEQMARKKQIQITTQIPPDLDKVQLDDRRMRQVLVNLLSNAVKFTPNGGSILLEVQVDRQQQTLCFCVSDTGIGIAPEHLSRLFQPFVQIDSSLSREYEGTGLGLTLVRRIVQLHGGSVEVASEIGKGSRFSVRLPLQGEAAAVSAGEAVYENRSIAPLATQAPLILLSEDNEANIETIDSYLLAKGYRLMIARNGLEALELAKRHRPDLILMDIQTPQMDGLEATRQIRRDRALANTPIIALTALAMPCDRQRCLEAGANAYLTKPIQLKRLLACIQEQLGRV